ncbi:MAG TPA: hypothetical protein VIJ27_11475 [Mucilaginibacter sp.]
MVIERLNQDIIIRPAAGINMGAVQKVIDYINVLEIAAQNRGTEEQAAELAREVDTNWWKENKHRFLP